MQRYIKVDEVEKLPEEHIEMLKKLWNPTYGDIIYRANKGFYGTIVSVIISDRPPTITSYSQEGLDKCPLDKNIYWCPSVEGMLNILFDEKYLMNKTTAWPFDIEIPLKVSERLIFELWDAMKKLIAFKVRAL